MGRGHQKNLLQAVDAPRTANNLLHQGPGYAFAARLRPHIDAPDMSFVALLIVMAAIEASRGRKPALFKHADNEIGCGIARTEALARRFDRGALVLFGGVGERSWVIAESFKAQMPEGFGVSGNKEADIHVRN